MNKVPNAEVSDTTGDDSSTAAKYKKTKQQIIFAHQIFKIKFVKK
jgi:hypothetical protein